MTVSSTTNTNSYTTVNATTHSFAYGFKIFADADLEVIVRSAAGAETVKTLNTHFVVTNAGVDTGGNVLFKFNTGTSSDAHFSSTDRRPASGETVLLRRSLSLTQGTDYIENDSFSSNSHENALDRLTFITQSLGEELNRSFKVSKTNTIASAEFADSAATRASKTLGFDSDGNLTTVADFLPIGGDAAQFTYSTTTTDADPGSGFIRFNHATLASASIAYVDDNEINGTDVSAWVLSFDDVSSSASNRGRIRMSKSNTLDTWAVYKISGASTDASGYVKLALTYIDSAGTFANNDKVFLSFVATGAGETGATGATGASGASAADNITLGDAAVSIATSAGNITIDAQGSDTDIIFKGTDGSSDITPLTLDMSDAGKAIFTGAATIAGLATVGGTLGVTGITTLANNLIIPNGGNIGSVGDTDAIAIATNGVVTFSQTPVGAGGAVVQVKNVQRADSLTGTSGIAADDTIPQQNEGTEVLTLEFTPTSASNKLLIQIIILGSSSHTAVLTPCLFQDSTAGALAAVTKYKEEGTGTQSMSLNHYMAAGTTSATTFKVRVGVNAGTFTLNGYSGARKLGGVASSSMTISEVTP